MWIRKGFSFKLTPDGAQAREMSRFAGCTRFVYNKGIAWNEEQRNADSNFRISYKALSAQLPIWKENHPWLAETYSQCLQQAMKDLSQGFQRFFAGDAGFPKFHKKFASTDSFRFPQNFKINEGNKQILLPGIGWVKYRRSRFIEGKPKNVTVSRRADVGTCPFRRGLSAFRLKTKETLSAWTWASNGSARCRTALLKHRATP